MNKIEKVISVAADAAINTASGAAGSVVGVYCMQHDICNNEEMSTIVGISAGICVFTVTRGVLKHVSAASTNTFQNFRTKLNKQSKKNSVNE